MGGRNLDPAMVDKFRAQVPDWSPAKAAQTRKRAGQRTAANAKRRALSEERK